VGADIAELFRVHPLKTTVRVGWLCFAQAGQLPRTATECIRTTCRIVRPFRTVAPHLVEQALPPLLARLRRRCGLRRWRCHGSPTRRRRQSAPDRLLDIQANDEGRITRHRIWTTWDDVDDLRLRARAQAGDGHCTRYQFHCDHCAPARNRQYPLLAISSCCSASIRSVRSQAVHSSRSSLGSSACLGTIGDIQDACCFYRCET
jgi:hypothetical protein